MRTDPRYYRLQAISLTRRDRSLQPRKALHRASRQPKLVRING